MTQLIYTRFHAQDTAVNQNKQLEYVVKPGIYAGFRVKPNVALPYHLDITVGADDSSVLVTSEGVKVEETESIIGAVKLAQPDPTLTRIDAIVAEYAYVPNANIQQTYKAIRGQNQPDTDSAPTKPEPESDFQVVLAYVTVRPSSSGIQNIDITDIEHVPLAPWSDAALKPIIEPNDPRRVYVYPGRFISVDRTSPVEFGGGYSPIIDPVLYQTNEVRYIQLGLTDDGLVSIIGQASSEDLLPALTTDVLPVAIARVRKSFGQVVVETLKDIRFAYSREHSRPNELLFYADALSGSVFKDLRVETFSDASAVDLDSVKLVGGSQAFLTASVDTADTSLTISWTGPTKIPSEDVTISTADVLAGGLATKVAHFMVLADTSFSGLRFQYSVSAATAGYTAESFRPNEIVRIPGGQGTKLFIKFIIPRSAFSATKVAKLFSYGLLYGLDATVLNANTLSDLGISSLKSNLQNLIPNGQFYYWSRPSVEGSVPDLSSPQELIFPFSQSTDDINAGDSWQVTKWGGPAKSNQISRVWYSIAGQPSKTALKFTASSSMSGPTYVEYRYPLPAELVGRTLTFSFDYRSGVSEAVGIGIVVYRFNGLTLEVLSRTDRVALTAQGTLVVQTDGNISTEAAQIGFYIMFLNTGAETTTYVTDARAAIGDFNDLPYTPAPNASAILPAYAESGRSFLSCYASEGTVVGVASQFAGRKLAIGSVEARIQKLGTANRSVGLSDITLEATSTSVVAASSAIAAGPVLLDVDWEVFVRYEGSPT